MRATHSFISIKAPFQGACRQQQTSLLSKDSVHFQADSNKPKEGPLSLTADELGKLSLKEKQQLFAKLPLLKYQGKPLTGSEFLNLVYHYPYPEKNAWVHSRDVGVEIFSVSVLGLLTAGFIPMVCIGGDNREGMIPLLPRKGISTQSFESFCQNNLSSLKDAPIKPIQILKLFHSLRLVYSLYNNVKRLETIPPNSPITFTNAAKRLMKEPVKKLPTQSLLNNHTFANQLEVPLT
jgi:hypothetical protein